MKGIEASFQGKNEPEPFIEIVSIDGVPYKEPEPVIEIMNLDGTPYTEKEPFIQIIHPDGVPYDGAALQEVRFDKHLHKGIKPIRAYIDSHTGTHETFDHVEHIRENGEYIDFLGIAGFKIVEMDEYGDAEIEPIEIYGNSGEYVISGCNEKSKFSREYRDCTGLVVCGVDKVTGKEVSILSHQDPKKILEEKK